MLRLFVVIGLAIAWILLTATPAWCTDKSTLAKKIMHLNWEHIIPQAPPPPGEIIEALEATTTTREFYQEVEYREDFDRYCQWYYETADRHRQEMQKMLGDFNLLGWFWRGRH